MRFNILILVLQLANVALLLMDPQKDWLDWGLVMLLIICSFATLIDIRICYKFNRLCRDLKQARESTESQ